MKINVTVLSQLRTVTIEINETELIDSLSQLLNNEFKFPNVEYNFIINKNIYENGKTVGDLNLVDNCTVFAVKKSETPLKRKFKHETLKSLLVQGPTPKKLFVESNDDHFKYATWKNKDLCDIQKQISDIVTQETPLLESLVLQPQVEHLIKNPHVISSMFSANPIINETINNSPSKVKFFTDVSQYDWIKNIIRDSSQFENVSNNYLENVKNISENIRYKRMMGVYEKTCEVKTSENEDTQTGPDNSVLQPLLKSTYFNDMVDLVYGDEKMGASLLKCCPYGSCLSEVSLSSIQKLMPEIATRMKQALSNATEPGEIVKYMAANPIEIDEELASNLEDVTAKFEDSTVPVNPFNDDIVEMICALSSKMKRNETEDLKSQFVREIELLNEMGFVDDELNVRELTSEYGNIDRVVNKLLSV